MPTQAIRFEDSGGPGHTTKNNAVEFKSFVQEVRFEVAEDRGSQGAPPSVAASGETDSRGSIGGLSRMRDWRATTTTEGDKYFYNVTSHESRWSLPSSVEPSTPGTSTVQVGAQADVFSNSRQQWCSGYVEKVADGFVTVAFQLPAAKREEWSKKVLPADHKDLRLRLDSGGSSALDDSPTTPRRRPCTTEMSFQDTQLPTNWTPAEAATFDGLLRDPELQLTEEPAGQQQPAINIAAASELFSRSLLPRRALKEIWQVANPELAAQIGRYEFWACCRLIACCQDFVRRNDTEKDRQRPQGISDNKG
eukprot:TRINITY_DN18377_c0_g1_i3.p1 TRINITY_DN18377_c0_g1~~TRINITY_DN18377_c0_g1_i3.p1  ORF type:complete len:307 (+),score=59.58 TRINITY_DN18377_c0_g1_i3:196-1116(+)